MIGRNAVPRREPAADEVVAVSGSPLSPIQRAYVMILEDAVVGSRVAGYRTGLLRALEILERVDPDAPGGTDPIDPRASQGSEGSA
jgi:hypothetical protein